VEAHKTVTVAVTIISPWGPINKKL